MRSAKNLLHVEEELVVQRPQTLSERPAARPPHHHSLRIAAPHPRPLLQMLPALINFGCHIHIRNSAQAQNLLRSEDGEPNLCGGEQQLPCAVENTDPRRSFPSDGLMRCFSFHYELLQLGEQALEDHCADAHLFGTLGQRPTVGITHTCGDRFFLTQGHLRERGGPVLLILRVHACCLAFSVCAVWEHDGVKIVCLRLCPHVCACSFRASVCAVWSFVMESCDVASNDY